MRTRRFGAIFLQVAQLHLALLLILGASLTLIQSGLAGVYQHIEASFNITNLVTNPFDYTVTDVEVQMVQPDNSTITMPAFFNGGTNWRVRHSPKLPGFYQITNITLNGSPLTVDSLQPTNWTVAGTPIRPGYIQTDPTNWNRFITSDGRRYFPVGENVAWDEGSSGPNHGVVTNCLARLGPVHANWSRIWMAPWDGTSLETGYAPLYSFGVIPMAAATKWDNIVDAAEQNGINFQMVMENFVEYNTVTGFTYWSKNPWNTANGGFLSNPAQYFTNTTAVTLTKQMMRYAVARWGYSPSIMAWELFNEVELTDELYADNETNTVTQWHIQMASFIRSQDNYHHLITTSSMSYPEAYWAPCDYYQHHDYTSTDYIADTRNADPPQVPFKPIFGGECGTNNSPNGVCAPLWASLMNGQSGADGLWWWDGIDKGNSYIYFRALSDFVRLSGLPEQNSIATGTPSVNSTPKVLKAYVVANNQFAAFWFWNTNNVFATNPVTTVSGTFSLSGLRTGNYSGTWWEPLNGTVISNFTFSFTTGNPITLTTPPILRATALFVGTPPQSALLTTNLTVSLSSNSAPFTLPLALTNSGGLPLTYSLNVIGASAVAYTALDSTQVGGPVFQWHDISDIGTDITTNFTALVGSKTAADEGIAGPIDIGLSFPFFSTAQSPSLYTQLYISPNGFVTFSPFTGDQSTNVALPNPSAPANLIALFWDDLIVSNSTSHVYVLSDPLEGTFTVQFQDVQEKSSSATVTCQLILKTTGEILMEYRSMGASGTGTVGVQNAPGSAGLTVAYDQNYPPSNLAVSLTPVPWLGLTAGAGVVPTLSADTLDLSINPTALKAGTNIATVLITTGDANNPTYVVPVEMDVVPTAPPVLGGSRNGPGGISLTISGGNGQSYHLYMSTNLGLPLAAWTPVTNGVIGASPVIYNDSSTLLKNPRFFRVGSP